MGAVPGMKSWAYGLGQDGRFHELMAWIDPRTDQVTKVEARCGAPIDPRVTRAAPPPGRACRRCRGLVSN